MAQTLKTGCIVAYITVPGDLIFVCYSVSNLLKRSYSFRIIFVIRYNNISSLTAQNPYIPAMKTNISHEYRRIAHIAAVYCLALSMH